VKLSPVAAFAVVSLLWGTPYLFVKVALDDGVPAMFVAWFRIIFAAALLMALAWRQGHLPSLRGHWRWLAVYGVIELAMPFALISAGEQYVSSAMAAEIIAAVPLVVALLALRYDAGDTLTLRRMAGLLIGFAGVVALLGIDLSGDEKALLGGFLLLIAVVGFSIGPLVFKRHLAHLDANASVGAGLTLAAISLTPFAIIDHPTEVPGADTLAMLALLGSFCTAASLVLFAQLIQQVGPGRAVLTTYVAPIIAVVLGMLVLDERLGPGAIVGMVLILFGSWLATQMGGDTPVDALGVDAPVVQASGPRAVPFPAGPVEHDPRVRDHEQIVDGVRWALVEYEPGAGRREWCTEPHMGYVVSGEIEYAFADGRPSLRLGAGEAFRLPTDPPHRGHNHGTEPSRLFLIDALAGDDADDRD
jgi:drug/metabolite transporter (DMT)-like permease/quercetin dioxygenase-like cupin family protein